MKVAAIALFAFMTLGMFQATYGQKSEKMDKKMNIEQRIDKMKKHLQLTDDQATKIKTILENTKAEAKRNRETYSDKEARQNAMHELRNQTRDKIKAVLTPDQLQKFEKRQEKKQQ